MTTRSVKANTLRERHIAILKKTFDTVNTLTNDACISTITVYKGELDSNWTNFSDAFVEHEESIIGKDDQKNILEQITSEYSEVYSNYVKARIKLGKFAERTCLNSNTSISNLNSTGLLDNSLNGNGEQNKSFKLPPIRLPKFAGEYKDWPEFKATCRSILTDKIHDVQRLQHLKEALQGEPRELVKHILPSDGCYDKAMFLLKNRYDNQRASVNEQLNRLYAMPRNEPGREQASVLRTIVNTINSTKAALEECAIDTINTLQCLHIDSRKAWEEKLEGTRVNPNLSKYVEFLETRATILENNEIFSMYAQQSRSKSFVKPVIAHPSLQKERPKILFTLRNDYECDICKRNHLSSRCDEVGRIQNVKDRIMAVKKSGVCYNCLQPFHQSSQCPFELACKRCNGKHNTLLHEPKQNVMVTQTSHAVSDSVEEENENHNKDESNDSDTSITDWSEHFFHIDDGNVTMLATAIVPIQWNGRSILVRALIDLGSTANVITESACQLLNLPLAYDDTPMTGLGNTLVGRSVGRTRYSIGSLHDKNYKFDASAIVVKRITEIAPVNDSNSHNWSNLSQLALADPNFLETNKIDLLLGAAVYAEIVLSDVVKGNSNEPIAQNTKLGYIVFGPTHVNKEFTKLCYALKANKSVESNDNLSKSLKAFWEIEEVESTQSLSVAEIEAENAFVGSLQRTSDGKFMVDLPFKVDPKTAECLGESRTQAEKRLRANQRRFNKNPDIKTAYDQNIAEYLTLGHMKELESHEIARCFLPHHPVIKESSSTTKVRTVFDASAKTTNGCSLNSLLYVGPTIQPELFDLLIQWRLKRYAFSGDIEKMYRQVWVNPEHTLFQCILWQPPGTDEIKIFKLLTVTFGTSSAPFQAIRSLDEIGRRIESEQPVLAEQIRKHFYVDDYLGAADDLETAIILRRSITEELAKYGFNLRKWKANDEQILYDVHQSEREELVSFETTFKTLGIAWQPSTDMFQFKSTKKQQIEEWTKRQVLSEIAKLFDPLGWLSPCVSKAKMLMQDIWRVSSKIDWDTPVPAHIAKKWERIYEQLCSPISIRVPRWIGLSKDAINIEIHGFCDASNAAYAAAIYIKITYSDDNIATHLIASKTKLAPIKTVTIPRLELCGAVLLTNLLIRCKQSPTLNECPTFAWCDSMIVLAWLASCPSRWTTFVSNRVSCIQKKLPIEHWHHVSTKQNPADVASRGALISELSDSELWWHGPEFIRNKEAIVNQPIISYWNVFRIIIVYCDSLFTPCVGADAHTTEMESSELTNS